MDRSKWTPVLSNSLISSEKANAMLTTSINVVLCQYVYEMTACESDITKREAYKIYKRQRKDENNISEEQWEKFYQRH